MIKRFEALLAQGTDNPMLRLTLGTAYWKAGDTSSAIGHLQHAVAEKPDYSAAFKILGRAYMDAGLLQEATDAFEHGLTAATENGDKQSEKEIQVFKKRLDKLKSQP